MSNRAEEFALKAYPDDMGTLAEVKYISRLAFKKGYEQAEKDFMERAVKWIYEYRAFNFSTEFLANRFIEDFKKAVL